MDFQTLTQYFDKLETTSKRSQKTVYVTQILRNTKLEELKEVLLLIQGTVFDSTQTLGISAQYIIKSLSISTGYSKDKITQKWKELGDLGTVAYELIKTKQQVTLFSSSPSVQKIFTNLHKLISLSGQGSADQKVKLIADLLSGATPSEAKYIVRFCLEVMRTGVGPGIIRDALYWTYMPAVSHIFEYDKTDNCFVPTSLGFEKEEHEYLPANESAVQSLEITSIEQTHSLSNIEKIELFTTDNEKLSREVYNYYVNLIQLGIDLTNDVTKIALMVAKRDVAQLQQVTPQIFQPIQVMLAKKAIDIEDGIKQVGTPCMAEYKYDGFRMQIHKKGTEVKLYTRRLDDVTTQFPEVVQYVKEHIKAKTCILDSEAVGYEAKTKKYTPFQHISQRIRRKHGIEVLQKELPVELNIFDILFLDDVVHIHTPFLERRNILEKLIEQIPYKIRLSEAKIFDSVEKVNIFYQESLQNGNEGIMLKTLDAPYKPGSRVGFMIKLKPTMDTLDLVITKATWGEGKRANWLTSFTISCYDEGDLKEIGKVGTGFKELDEHELTFAKMTQILQIVSEQGKEAIVKPTVVLEIAYEEIQKSNTYSSGYALRFPRVVRIREKGVDQASTLELVEDFYFQQ